MNLLVLQRILERITRDQMVPHRRLLLLLSLDFSLVVDQRLLANKLYKVEISVALRLLGRIIQKYSIISKS